MTGDGRGIYLAGPIEHDDTPRDWRDLVRDQFPDVTWIDPMEWQDEWESDPAAVWQRELETCRSGAVLACNIGSDGPRTTGTHHEIRAAINHGQPVAIVPKGEVSQVYRDIENVRLFDDVSGAVEYLRDAETVAGDGGVAVGQRPLADRWHAKAQANVDEWGQQDLDELLLASQEELGELTQAYLESVYEDGQRRRIADELDDLGALLVQMAWALDGGPADG